MFNAVERAMLKAASRPLLEGRIQTTDNPKLEETIARIRAMSPEKFHTEASLSTRRFFHQPKRGEPYASCVVPLERKTA